MDCTTYIQYLLDKEDLSFEEVEILAYYPFVDEDGELDFDMFEAAHNKLFGIFEKYGTAWDDGDKDYPYLWGYELEGHNFIFGYSGVAGRYWVEDSCTVCKP